MGKDDDIKFDLDIDLSKYIGYKNSDEKKAKVTLEDILGGASSAEKPEVQIKSAPIISVEPESSESEQLVQDEPAQMATSDAPEVPMPDFSIAIADDAIDGEATEPIFVFGKKEGSAVPSEAEKTPIVPSADAFNDVPSFAAKEPEEAAVIPPIAQVEDEAQAQSEQKSRVVEEYSSISEREDILSDLKKLLRKISLKTTVMTILFLVGAYLTIGRLGPFRFLLPQQADPNASAENYCFLFLVLSVICFFFNINPLFDGMKKMFCGRLTSDGIAFCLGLSCIGSDVYFWLHPEAFAASMINFDILFLLMLLMNLTGKRLLVKHILSNFAMFSDERPKTVISRPQSLSVNNDIMIETGDGGDVLYACRTKTVADYMKYAFGEQHTDKKTDVFYLVIYLLMFALVGISLVFGTITIPTALVLLTGGFAICAPIFSSWTHILGIYRLGKLLRASGTMISGREGAKAMSESGVLVVKDTDLLTDSSISLHSMKIRNGCDSVEVLTFMAALFKEAGGPLEPFFFKLLDEIQDAELPRVNDPYYHEQLGYTCRINGKRITVGTSEFLSQCGIVVHKSDAPQNSDVVCIAIDNIVSGIFILTYTVPPKTQKALSLIDAEGLSLAIVTADFNLKEAMFTSYVTDTESITILSYDTAIKCDKLYKETEIASGDIVTYDYIRGMALGLYGCNQLLTDIVAHCAYKITASMFGLIIMAVMSIMLPSPGFWLPFQILAFQFLWTIPNYFRGLKRRV